MSFKALHDFNLYEKQISLIKELSEHRHVAIKKARNVGCDYAVMLYLTLSALSGKSNRIGIMAPKYDSAVLLLDVVKGFLDKLDVQYDKTSKNKITFNCVEITALNAPQSLRGHTYDTFYISEYSLLKYPDSSLVSVLSNTETNGQIIVSSKIGPREGPFHVLYRDSDFHKVYYKWTDNPDNSSDKLINLINNLKFDILCQEVYCKYLDSPQK